MSTNEIAEEVVNDAGRALAFTYILRRDTIDLRRRDDNGREEYLGSVRRTDFRAWMDNPEFPLDFGDAEMIVARNIARLPFAVRLPDNSIWELSPRGNRALYLNV